MKNFDEINYLLRQRVIHKLWLKSLKEKEDTFKYFILSYDKDETKPDHDPHPDILEMLDELDGVPLVFPEDSSIIFYSFSSPQSMKLSINRHHAMTNIHYTLYFIGYDLNAGTIRRPKRFPDDGKRFREHYRKL